MTTAGSGHEPEQKPHRRLESIPPLRGSCYLHHPAAQTKQHTQSVMKDDASKTTDHVVMLL